MVATLLDAVDLVVLAVPERARAGDARRLQARARERGAVLVVLGPGGGFEADVSLVVSSATWCGLEQGAGRLQARQVVVEAGGRRQAARPRRLALWLPDAAGEVRVVDPVVARAPLGVVGGGGVSGVADDEGEHPEEEDDR